jgi:hypothetical protein
VDETITEYFAAWNETNPEARRSLLQRSLSDDVELVDPTGRWGGIDVVSERIANYHFAAPGTAVVSSSGVDSHNDVERYAWRIVDGDGNEIMEGLDVAERDIDGRLRRILMFHGPLLQLTEPPRAGCETHLQKLPVSTSGGRRLFVRRYPWLCTRTRRGRRGQSSHLTG